MDLSPYVDRLHDELLAAAETGEASALAQRLAAAVASATRLTMLEVLSDAAGEITRELAPGSVEVRLTGRDPLFVVTPPDFPGERDDIADEPAEAVVEPPPLPSGNGAVARINFRPPEQLMQRIEAAATAEGLSVNAWLVRAATAALTGDRQRERPRTDATSTRHVTGWVG